MSFLLSLLAIIVIAAVLYVLYLIGLVVEPLWLLLPQVAKNVLLVVFAIAFIVGMNIIAYRASYVTKRRDEWFFWLCLSVTVAFLLLLLTMFAQG